MYLCKSGEICTSKCTDFKTCDSFKIPLVIYANLFVVNDSRPVSDDIISFSIDSTTGEGYVNGIVD